MNRSFTRSLACLFPVLLAAPLGCGGVDEGAPPAQEEVVSPRVITARTFGTAESKASAPAASGGEEHVGAAAEALNSGHGIAYNGGHVMSGTVNLYYIWYGNWSGNSATSILTDLGNNLSGSAYYNINTLYDDQFGGRVANSLHLAGQTTDAYSQGSSLSFNGVWNVVVSALQQGRLPNDPNGVYFVLTSSDVTQSNGSGSTFCGSYCGWHTYGTYGNNIKFAFVGNGDQCPSSCRPYPGPNGNAGADGMASVLVHELDETVTDPQIDAWHNANSQENGDMCAWTFGSTYTAGNGAPANIHLGSRDYLIQQDWVNTGSGSCGMSYSPPPACGAMYAGQSLGVGQSVWSCDGRFNLVMQGDGNLVLYQNGAGALWSTGTWGTTGSNAVMQGDGNFVLYNTSGQALWNSVTWGNPGSWLAIQNDGNLVVYSPSGSPLWNSGTWGH